MIQSTSLRHSPPTMMARPTSQWIRSRRKEINIWQELQKQKQLQLHYLIIWQMKEETWWWLFSFRPDEKLLQDISKKILDSTHRRRWLLPPVEVSYRRPCRPCFQVDSSIYEEGFLSVGSGVAQTTPVYRPQRAPKVPTYDPFVRPNPLEFAAAQGQVVVKEVISDF